MLHVRCLPVEFVHDCDPAFRREGARPGPDEHWFLASGQPAECTRFAVRPLSALEYDAVVGLEDAKERAVQAVDQGLVAVDGETHSGELAMGWALEVANLVVRLSVGPFGAGRSPASSSSGSAADASGSPAPNSGAASQG